MKKFLLFLFVLVALCGCNKQQTTPTTEQIVKSVSSDGNLNIHCFSQDGYNPIFADNNANMNLGWICFEPLVKITDAHTNETVLAQGYFISEDGLTWTVPLRSDVYWHDGTGFTSADVVATCNTIMENKDESPYYYNLSNVENVEAPDEYTVVFHLKSSKTNFANLLEFPVVKAENCHIKKDFPIIGTGVFKYMGTANKRLFFEINNEWWGKLKPHIKNITAVMLPDKETAGYSYNANVIDVVPASIKDWNKYPSASDRSVMYSTGGLFYLKFNTVGEVLSNYEIRSAIAQAIDKNELCDMALLSHGVVTDTFLNPNWEFYSEKANSLKLDPENAKTIVKNNYGDGRVPLSLIVNEESEIKVNSAHVIKDLLYPVGIDINVMVYSWEDYMTAYYAGEYDIALCETNVSPDLIPTNIIGSSEEVTNIVYNLENCGVNDKRKEYFHNLQKQVCLELNILPLYYDMGVLLYSERVKSGLSPTRTNIYNNIHLWRLDT